MTPFNIARSYIGTTEGPGPADNPVISLAVVVENGGGGASAAAPVARAVLDAFFAGEEFVTREH